LRAGAALQSAVPSSTPAAPGCFATSRRTTRCGARSSISTSWSGSPSPTRCSRDEWANRGLELLRSFGLAAELDVANDPFFGRRGRMLARNQQAEKLKLELLVPIAGPEPTACASFNHHRDHFGSNYGIELSDGSTAHTACLGFGHERIVLGLLRIHGFDLSTWPAAVRAELWPSG
jgi:hypothetical protein